MVVAERGRAPLDTLADLARTLRIANAPILGVLLAHARRFPGLRLRSRRGGNPPIRPA
jgi:hypothetical protein